MSNTIMSTTTGKPVEHLQFYYSADEFALKFLPASHHSVINTCIDQEGDVHLYFMDEVCNCVSYYVYIDYILDDLKDEYESLLDENYDYKVAYSYVEMESPQYHYQDLVFFRIEKTPKEN